VPVLTDAAVRRYKPAAARRRIRDAGARSLFLVVEPSGHKSWEMRFRRPGGKPAKMRLGPFDLSGREVEGTPAMGQPLTLAAARALAERRAALERWAAHVASVFVCPRGSRRSGPASRESGSGQLCP
jgi:hypothetical protein